MNTTRRKVITGVSVAIAGGLAGCTGGDSDDGPEEVDFDQNNSDVDEDDISVPALTFSFSYREDDGVVSISHLGGRSVSADRLYIRGEGVADEYNETSFPELPNNDIEAGSDFRSGDDVTVEVVEDAFRVEVVWVDEETNYPVTVDEYSEGMDG